MNRRTLFNALKLLFAVALVWMVVAQTGPEKIRATLTSMDVSDWLLGFVVLFGAYCISMLRWRMLMHSVGIEASWWDAFRLGFIGAFFNNVVPGLTGGDLVKAFYVARENPGRRADAILTVVVDRISGIVALALIAAVVIPFDFDSYREAAAGIYGFLLVAGVGACVALSRRIKSRLRRLLERFGRRGPSAGASLLSKLDRAVDMYRDRIGVLLKTLVLGACVHLLIITSVGLFADAISKGNLASHSQLTTDPAVIAGYERLGELSLAAHCSVVPIIMIISALPIAPAGWGVGEYAFKHFYGDIGVADELAVSLSFTYRLSATLLSLLGALFLVLDRERVLSAARREGDAAAGR